MLIKDILQCLETFAPLSYQESYDNSGLLVGNRNAEATSALLCLDVTEDILDEAISLKCNLIIAHHPVVFSGLKKITGNNFVERVIIKAIKNDIAIYACHTNIDNVKAGVNKKIADKLGLKNQKILSPKNGVLQKLETFVPEEQAAQVRQALFAAGCGNIGNYSECSFSSEGMGTFRGNEESNPVVGTKGISEKAKEIKVEVVFEKNRQSAVIQALKQSHPYEEIAYYIHSLDNYLQTIGAGMIGELETEEELFAFLERVKTTFRVPVVKHTAAVGKIVRKIALCGGSGSFLLKDAIRSGADLFLTADFKYHQFFDAENKIVICDIGHYETEQFSPEIFYEVISKKFPTFALHLSKVNTNPINYF
ncbi:MAG: NGG1p interacting factor 3 protein [Bacteroidetes bacterium]|jgi:dinuclear metal center YbgI/SA1388 family protein|nr:NGG1p interacting factor 3 protein [Bacteroidota bacterium]